jgi:hypothetical protein
MWELDVVDEQRGACQSMHGGDDFVEAAPGFPGLEKSPICKGIFDSKNCLLEPFLFKRLISFKREPAGQGDGSNSTD